MLASSSGILGRRGRGLADIGRGKDELAEGDVADFAASGHGGDSATGGREPSLALENPSQTPSRPSSSVACRRDRCGGGEGAAAGWGRSLVLFRYCRGPPLRRGSADRRWIWGSRERRVSAVMPKADRCVVFGAIELRDTIGDRDDQSGLRRIPRAGRAAAGKNGWGRAEAVDRKRRAWRGWSIDRRGLIGSART